MGINKNIWNNRKKLNSDSEPTYHIRGVELLAHAIKCGLTVADFKSFSIGYIIDFCTTTVKLLKGENLHEAEEKYHKLKDVLPFVEENYKNGKTSAAEYEKFMSDFKISEERYG